MSDAKPVENLEVEDQAAEEKAEEEDDIELKITPRDCLEGLFGSTLEVVLIFILCAFFVLVLSIPICAIESLLTSSCQYIYFLHIFFSLFHKSLLF